MMTSSYMAVEVLERRLAAVDKELKERVERIGQLEKELSQRDALVRQLRADLDKCQQVLKPLTQVQAAVAAETAEMAQIAPWRLTSKNGPNQQSPVTLEPRFKRLAISAEPLLLPRSLLLANAAELKQSLPVNRQPKSAQ
jgi:chromosome segregation ATPase